MRVEETSIGQTSIGLIGAAVTHSVPSPFSGGKPLAKFIIPA
jgi:hypothetical protein